MMVAWLCPLKWRTGRIHNLGEEGKQVSKRSLTQANRIRSKWVKLSSPQRIPTPLKRCWISYLQALSTKPLPIGSPMPFNWS